MYLFSNWRIIFYRILLFFVKHQHESAMISLQGEERKRKGAEEQNVSCPDTLGERCVVGSLSLIKERKAAGPWLPDGC